MAGFIPSKSRLSAGSIDQPNLRLVPSDRASHVAIDRTPDQSPKTAVMACLSARSSGNSELLRKASAAARENDGEFYAVLVDSPGTRFRTAQVRGLIDNAILATYLGAKIVWLDSSDVVGGLLQFAQQSRIGRIFVARTRPTPFSRLFGRSVYANLLCRAEGFHIDVVRFDPGN